MITLLSSTHDALRFTAACAVLFAGAGLWAYCPHYRFTMSRRIKNWQLTESDAQRAIALFKWSGPGMTALGIVLLLTWCIGS